MAQFVGILNLTADSFSDGGRFLQTQAAIAHGEQLLADGADWLDLGAESSNPAGERVDAQVEIERLTPVLRHFRGRARLSVDAYKPEVVSAALALGVEMVNDITALRDPQTARVVANSTARVVLMFARNLGPRAEAKAQPYRELVQEQLAFFSERIATLGQRGIAKERLLLDPGMGFFLGSNPEPSLWMLKHLPALRALGCPLYVCSSRKSFIGATLGGVAPSERSAGTLATELWALHQGVDFIRTHDVRAAKQAWVLWSAIDSA